MMGLSSAITEGCSRAANSSHPTQPHTSRSLKYKEASVGKPLSREMKNQVLKIGSCQLAGTRVSGNLDEVREGEVASASKYPCVSQFSHVSHGILSVTYSHHCDPSKSHGEKKKRNLKQKINNTGYISYCCSSYYCKYL